MKLAERELVTCKQCNNKFMSYPMWVLVVDSMVHSKQDTDMKKAIKKAMDSYSIEEITTLIRQKSRRWISISPFSLT